MKILESTKVDVYFNQPTSEIALHEQFNNVVTNASEAQLIAFSQLLNTITPDSYSLDSIVTIDRTRYTLDY
ncbi:hypothetical protein [Vagococcus intermedius]|uniref:Uncharacterized protein n=1 Tax=Vagococcus intermedius TaxID=2991418 RepID=A0AAF0CVU2_9ENTE|nr:hypothetical protein [Vagococcus intermedius]WEG73804.1 hypothetical protein OL234_02515 [Vagococcus intermedius]WEG75889.1 hypothetical protein OL235_02525 [Vagococcus intermedius]